MRGLTSWREMRTVIFLRPFNLQRSDVTVRRSFARQLLPDVRVPWPTDRGAADSLCGMAAEAGPSVPATRSRAVARSRSKAPISELDEASSPCEPAFLPGARFWWKVVLNRECDGGRRWKSCRWVR